MKEESIIINIRLDVEVRRWMHKLLHKMFLLFLGNLLLETKSIIFPIAVYQERSVSSLEGYRQPLEKMFNFERVVSPPTPSQTLILKRKTNFNSAFSISLHIVFSFFYFQKNKHILLLTRFWAPFLVFLLFWFDFLIGS